MKNTLPFESFLSTLRATNRNLDFFVDWQKCLANKDKLSISLNHLNLLLGVSKENLQDKITLLFNEYAKAFDVLPLILAIRECFKFQPPHKKMWILFLNGCLVGKKRYDFKFSL